jgi:DNA-binding beta-propeller fold protein YncE
MKNNNNECKRPSATLRKARHLIKSCLLLISALIFISESQAQNELTFEFERAFGKKWPYAPGQFGDVNAIPPEGFNSPTGVAFQTMDRITVADRGNHKLQSCDDQGACYWIGGDAAFGSRNSPGVFSWPHGVAVSADGSLVVADENNHMLQVCNDTGACKASGWVQSQITNCSASLGRWCSLQDTATDSKGQIYGLDTGNNRIQVLRNSDLSVLDILMMQGSAPGQINNARGMAIDRQDRIVIADTGNHRIQVCDTDKNCTTFGSQGSAVGQFEAPVGVDVDALGRIWVADTGNHRIQACDYVGNCVAFGEFGSGEGQFNEPHDVAVHSSGRVAVVDTRNDRVQLFTTEASFLLDAGISSAWFDRSHDGEGFLLEILANNVALMFWYTFNKEGEQDWYLATGEISGNRIEFSKLYQTSGGIFGPDFDPDKIVREVVGSASFIFTGCDSGSMSYQIGTEQGSMVLERLTNLMGLSCGNAPALDAATDPVPEMARLSGSWFDRSHDGEGYNIEILSDGRVLIFWFTYGPDGKRRWMFGVGEERDGKIIVDELLTTSGGIFGPDFDPETVVKTPWGSLELEIDCSGGTATYSSSETGFGSGAFNNLEKLTNIDADIACPTEQ